MKRLAALALVALLAASVWVAAALADRTYTDPAGDSGAAPDITQIAVLNDAAGLITWRLTTAGSPALTTNQVAVVFLDTDRNATTGDRGDEYYLVIGVGGSALEQWNGSDFVRITPASFRASFSGNTVEFQVNRADIGNPTAFNFVGVTILFGDGDQVVAADSGPDGGSFTYELVLPQCGNGRDDDADGKVDAQDLGCSSTSDPNEADDPVTLRAGKASVVPARPKAGGAVVVSAPVTRVETGAAVSSGTVRCAMRVAGRNVKAAGRFAAGRASCRLTVPVAAKGQLARGTITVTHKGAAATSPFSFRAA